MSPIRQFFLVASALSLAGCATASLQPLPSLPATHPASPDAPQAGIHRTNTGLSDDGATQKTAELLNGDKKPATEETPAPAMPDMPGMNH